MPPCSARSSTIGIGGHLAVPPLPHHRAYGSVPRRFGGLSGERGSLTAGLSGPGAAVALSASCPRRPAASPGPGVGKASSHWHGGRVVVMRHPFYLPCPSTPSRGTVRAFGRQASLLRPLLTPAPRSGHLAMAPVPRDTAQVSWGKSSSLRRTPAGFTTKALD